MCGWTGGLRTGCWDTKIHALVTGGRQAAGVSLSAGNVVDAEAGRLLLETVGPLEETRPVLMDRAYEDDKTRRTAWGLRFTPVVPPKRNRKKPWDYDKERYKRRNEVERFFRRIQEFRCVFTRYEKLDRMFIAFVFLACICITLRSVNTP